MKYHSHAAGMAYQGRLFSYTCIAVSTVCLAAGEMRPIVSPQVVTETLPGCGFSGPSIIQKEIKRELVFQQQWGGRFGITSWSWTFSEEALMTLKKRHSFGCVTVVDTERTISVTPGPRRRSPLGF